MRYYIPALALLFAATAHAATITGITGALVPTGIAQDNTTRNADNTNDNNNNTTSQDTRPPPVHIDERRRRDLEITRADRMIYGEQTVFDDSAPVVTPIGQQSTPTPAIAQPAPEPVVAQPAPPTCPPGKTCTCIMGAYILEWCDSPGKPAAELTVDGANTCVNTAPDAGFNCAGQLAAGHSTMCNDEPDAAPFTVVCGTLQPDNPPVSP